MTKRGKKEGDEERRLLLRVGEVQDGGGRRRVVRSEMEMEDRRGGIGRTGLIVIVIVNTETLCLLLVACLTCLVLGSTSRSWVGGPAVPAFHRARPVTVPETRTKKFNSESGTRHAR